MSYSNKGFTLVELLVSIGIISTLMAFLLPNLMGARERAEDARLKENLASMRNALRMYYNDNQSYPTAASWNTSILNTAIGQTYFPAILNLGFTYEYMGGGDSFYLRAATKSTSQNELTQSQSMCGVSTPVTGYFYVCGK